MTGRIHIRYIRGHEGLICSKKYGELKKKEAEGGTLSEKEKRQIYEYEQNQKKSNGTFQKLDYKLIKEYLKDIKEKTGYAITKSQIEQLKKALRENKYGTIMAKIYGDYI